jgi:hypothetical protein
MRIRREIVNNVRTGQEGSIVGERNIGPAIQRDGLLRRGIADAKTAANNEAALHFMVQKRTWAPSKAELWAKVAGLGVIKIAANTHVESGQRIRLRAENGGGKLIPGEGHGAEIVPAQSACERQIWLNFVRVLNEKAIKGLAGVLPDVRRYAVGWIENSRLRIGSIVQEVPVVVEAPVRAR